MVDEINRASPRTQSALLQAMEEGNVTVTGREHALPSPFHVLATMNPLELEGTYPLPEAELDRFMMQIEITYPSLQAEKQIITQSLIEEPTPKAIVYASDLREFQKTVHQMPLDESGTNSILALVRAGRPETTDIPEVRQYVHWGPGPRAALALALTIRARATLHGRATPNMNDLQEMLIPVLRHRMALNYAARADGVSLDLILERLAEKIQKF
jgi:MoxR-like ATPase